MRIIKKIVGAEIALLPFTAFAITTDLGTALRNIIVDIQQILAVAMPAVLGLGIIVFLWGIVKYITASGDEEKIKEAKKFVMYGLLGVAIMVAIWGFIRIVVNLFGITSIPGTTPSPPGLPGI